MISTMEQVQYYYPMTSSDKENLEIYKFLYIVISEDTM